MARNDRPIMEHEPLTMADWPIPEPEQHHGNMGGPSPQVMFAYHQQRQLDDKAAQKAGVSDALKEATNTVERHLPHSKGSDPAVRVPLLPPDLQPPPPAPPPAHMTQSVPDMLRQQHHVPGQSIPQWVVPGQYDQGDRIAGMGQAMMNWLTSRGVTPNMAADMMKIHETNSGARTGDANRRSELRDRILAEQGQSSRNALSNLTQTYGVDQQAIAAGNTAIATAAQAQREGEAQQFQNFLKFASDRLGEDGMQALRDPKTMARILAEYDQAYQSFFPSSRDKEGKKKGMKDGGLVQGYADGGAVDPSMMDALGVAMADPVAEGAPAEMDSGDYVIPADVLRFYGLKFFQGMIQKAEEAGL